MTHLPQDPYMLLSVINMKLRDAYSSLDTLCDDLDVDQQEIRSVLERIDYHYDPSQNAFIR